MDPRSQQAWRGRRRQWSITSTASIPGRFSCIPPSYKRAHDELRAARGFGDGRRPYWAHGSDDRFAIAATRIGPLGVSRKRFLDSVSSKSIGKSGKLKWESLISATRFTIGLLVTILLFYIVWSMPYPWGNIFGIAAGFSAGALMFGDNGRR